MYRFFELFRHDNSLGSPTKELPWQYPYGLLEKIWLGFWALIATAGLVFYNHMVNAQEVLWVSAGMIALVLVVPQLTIRIGQNAVHLGRIALSIISSWAAYQRSAQFIASFRTTSYEAEMMIADKFLFGGNPSEWTEALINPVLTEYLQIIYMAYFPMMLLVGLGLLARGKQRSFYVYLLAMNLAFISCHVFYFLVPVRSPFLIADSAELGALISYSVPLEGLWFTEGMRQRLLDATIMRYDCFPSGHTMHSILVIYFGWRTHRAVRALLLVIGMSIIFSTIYLRYHYAIDLVAGGGFAVLWIWASHRLALMSWATDPAPQPAFGQRVLSVLQQWPDNRSD